MPRVSIAQLTVELLAAGIDLEIGPAVGATDASRAIICIINLLCLSIILIIAAINV